MTDEPLESAEGWWDEPWYRVRTDRFVASFLPRAGEDLDAVCNVDVEVRLTDGSGWSATLFTVDEVQRLMERWAQTGEEAGGSYFWCSDGLIVREAGVVSMAEAISGALDEGDFEKILQRLDDE
ncbi:hypothetical protein [Streptomyces sp. NPDC008139]|uniref:hypothetical protein n=1 Tax=Streptomyces sp. NPDC008139 TaxID=3364814 RepID=UPI0036ECED87